MAWRTGRVVWLDFGAASASVGREVRGIATRFGLLLGALFIFPFPLWLIPKAGPLVEWLGMPFDWLAAWLASDVLGVEAPNVASGSSDTTYAYVGVLMIVGLAVVATIAWSALDRKRIAYPRLGAALRTGLRYYLVYNLLSYGAAKVVKSQFCDLHPAILAQPLGDMPPMELMWAFMGSSRAYVLFAGLCELLAGVLLLWRRTVVLGALLSVVVMSNVVVLNFSYDVCVKLLSMQLLAVSLVLAWPGLRRVLAATMGHATSETIAPARLSPRWERAKWAAKVVLVALIAWQTRAELPSPSRNDHVHELYGGWLVDDFASDGVAHPPLATDPARWRLVAANPRKLVIYAMTGDREVCALTVDAVHHTLTVDRDEDVAVPDATQVREVWRYARPAPDRLTIDGVHRGKQLHIALHLAPPSRLQTRGFHWINEQPNNEWQFNR